MKFNMKHKKIYTKTGDTGQTSLFGGTRVPKHHIRVESYGSVDELNSWIGLLQDSINSNIKIFHTLKSDKTNILSKIQNDLFTLGSCLATDPTKTNVKIPQLIENDILLIEKKIDAIEETLTPLKNFILPGGHEIVSKCHITRNVCRRAERNITNLSENEPVDELIIKYMNRLSDYLFVLARKLSEDLDANEIIWKG